MFNSLGFLGTRAPMFMDIVTIFFLLLPFLMIFSIRYARNREYDKHIKSQTIILALSVFMVLLFEVGVRLTGGFLEYAKYSSINFDYLFDFLVSHVIIAIMALIIWVYLYILTRKKYKTEYFQKVINRHVFLGKLTLFLITITSLMGGLMYLFLFVL